MQLTLAANNNMKRKNLMTSQVNKFTLSFSTLEHYLISNCMRLLFLGILFLIQMTSMAQKERVDLAIKNLNMLLKQDCRFTMEKKYLTVVFTKNNEDYREDHLYLLELDETTVKYAEESQQLSVKCDAKFGECVDRKLLTQKKRSPYKRFVISMKDQSDDKIEKTTHALTELIKAYKKMYEEE